MTRTRDPHAGQPVTRGGPDPAKARIAVLLVHGRGSSPEDMLGLARALDLPDVSFLALAAAGHTWYPKTFLAPLEDNEPWLGSALGVLSSTLAGLGRDGIPPDRVALMGFSQGACLSLEFAARHPTRYRAVVALSGGLIGPLGMPRTYAGSLAGTPVFLGCSDDDAHIPRARVDESARVLRGMGAEVDERIYPQMGHTVVRDELEAAGRLLA